MPSSSAAYSTSTTTSTSPTPTVPQFVRQIAEKVDAVMAHPQVQQVVSFVQAQRCYLRSQVTRQLPFLLAIKNFLVRKGIVRDEPMVQAILMTLVISLTWSLAGTIAASVPVSRRLGVITVQVLLMSLIVGLAVQYKDALLTGVTLLLARFN